MNSSVVYNCYVCQIKFMSNKYSFCKTCGNKIVIPICDTCRNHQGSVPLLMFCPNSKCREQKPKKKKKIHPDVEKIRGLLNLKVDENTEIDPGAGGQALKYYASMRIRITKGNSPGSIPIMIKGKTFKKPTL